MKNHFKTIFAIIGMLCFVCGALFAQQNNSYGHVDIISDSDIQLSVKNEIDTFILANNIVALPLQKETNVINVGAILEKNTIVIMFNKLNNN